MDEQSSLNRAIYEEVRLAAYNPSWPALYEAERNRLFELFPDDFLAIEHIGSTAVPGLSAKPIIDLLAGLPSMAAADALIDPLCSSGYATSAAFNATLGERRWLMRWADGRRTHHLHLVVHDSRQWRELLGFRNILRSSQTYCQQYERLKKELAERHSSDREAYTAAKGDFILGLLARHAR